MTGVEILAAAAIAQGVSGFVGGMQQASMDKQNAKAATQQAAEEERRQRVLAVQRMGKATTAAASQGAGLDATDILSSNAATEELDALMIRYGGAVKSTQYRNQAKQSRTGAFGSLIGGFKGAGTSLYGSGGSGSAGGSSGGRNLTGGAQGYGGGFNMSSYSSNPNSGGIY